MSALKDIMDVDDVEPLDSQAAYRRAKEASQLQASNPSVDQPSASHSPSLDDNNNKGKTLKRRRSDRISNLAPTNVIRRRSSAAHGEDAMDYSSGYQLGMGVGGSNQASTSGSPQQSSRGSEQPTLEASVKYTPVTGRISKAKKGVPVHTCDICRPVKTFTRAEHLRRHQLSHQKPAYPCTFQDCERAFHRPDLLARHLHRHETQGEKAYKSPGSQSRGPSSSPSESRTPPLKVETPSQKTVVNQTSPSDSMTPRTTGGAEGSLSAFNAITRSSQADNFSPVSSNKRPASEAQLSSAGPYPPASPASGTNTRPPTKFANQITSSPFQSNSEINLANGDHFAPALQGFGSMFFEANIHDFPPQLGIPEETQDNSPWCSSVSDSNYSTQSDEPRKGRFWTMGSRPQSITADWSGPVGAVQRSPHAISSTPPDMRSPRAFDYTLETPFSSPSMIPSTSTREFIIGELFYGSTSSTRISDPGLAGIDRRKDMVEPQPYGSLGSLTMSSLPSYQTQLAQLDGYISSYWQSFDHLFPIIHRGTFDSAEDSLLSSAMAAMGTQYHDSPEARQRGIELNDYCRRGIGLSLNWNLHTMQAILLTELFTRFRGMKTKIETSLDFKELYKRLLNNSSRDQTPFSTYSSNAAADDLLLGAFNPLQDARNLHLGLHNDWTQWADTEARQRLLAACFMFDTHQSIYHEQKRSDVALEEAASMLCLPCQDNIWNASSAEDWQAQSVDYSVQQLPLVEQELSSQYVVSSSSFTQCLYICSLATRLPPREDPTYPCDIFPHYMDNSIVSLQTLFPTSPLAHSYLALHHTPLHDLLAVAGDTWVFGKKITPPSAFRSASHRLKTWSSSLAAAAAVQHACHVISTVLQPQSPEMTCVSHYWAIYTASLICWAFGHRYQLSSGAAMEIDSPLGSSADETKLRALTYVNGILELDTEDLLTSKASMKGDTMGVVDAVRSRLEIEGVGNKCMMIVDAVHVLTRIKEGGRGKWF